MLSPTASPVIIFILVPQDSELLLTVNENMASAIGECYMDELNGERKEICKIGILRI